MESAQVVISVDDLLKQIFLRLPVKSLMRFKLVSKHWNSLITSPGFILLRNPNPNTAVGLFFPAESILLPTPRISEFDYIHLKFQNPINTPFKKLEFPNSPGRFWIHQSCNGLLLCCSSEDSNNWFGRFGRFGIDNCCIYNPTTKNFVKLPKPGIVDGAPKSIHGVNIAFDHAKFAHYSVVCVRESEFSIGLMQIEIYSIKSRKWRVSGDPFSAKVDFDYGVYWNGSVHWIQYMTGEVLYFNVDQEKLGVVPKVNKPKPAKWGWKLDYFGESCDHLHLIGSYDSETEFNVYEMKKDYSEWFVKYKVDLIIVANAFPEVTSKYAFIDRMGHLFSVFSLIRGVEEEDSFLIFLIGSSVFRFNLERQTSEEIYEFGASVRRTLRFMGPCAFEYIESLACV